MNSHLNLFRTYSKEDRDYQLENDLTRALAVCLQEEPLFLHEFLKTVFSENGNGSHFRQLFATYTEETKIEIDIQKQLSAIGSFEYLYAVGISGKQLGLDSFFAEKPKPQSNRITDLFIRYENVVIICEVKPAEYGLTNQLYNQACDAVQGNIGEGQDLETMVTAVDMNWSRVMDCVVHTSNFHNAVSRPSRYLLNFIELIKKHNTGWLPVVPLAYLRFEEESRIYQRLDAALSKLDNKLEYSDRMGLQVKLGWASEIIFWLERRADGEYVYVGIWPGNTKQQGWNLFGNGRAPEFKPGIKLKSTGETYDVHHKFHLKFTNSHGKYITELTDTFKNARKPLLTYENFSKVSGRQLRGDNDWKELQDFFDEHFDASYKWRDRSQFQNKLVEKNYTQFNLSFGYNLYTLIPYSHLKQQDVIKEDISSLTSVIKDIETQYAGLLMA